MKRYAKRIRTTVVIAMLMAGKPAMSQIIYTKEDHGTHLRGISTDPNPGVMVPMQNVNLDQFTQTYLPLGDGWLLLIGLGGGYLIKKGRDRKKEKNR